MLTHAEFMAMRRFPALDGLRAIAAVIVVVSHFAGPEWTWVSGWVGVYVFFVLSGFLITTLLLREQSTNGRISLKAFYLRRVFRILPPYLVILGFIVLFCWLRGEFHSRAFPTALPYYLTFFNEFLPAVNSGGPDNFFSGSWTLGVEEKFYLFWPALMVVVGVAAVKRRIAVAVAALAAMVLFIPFTGGWIMDYSQTLLYESTVHYAILLIGALLAILMHNERSFAFIAPLTHPLAAIPVAIGFVALHVNMTDLWASTRNNLWLLLGYALLVAMLLVVLVSRGPLRWLLSTAPMRFVGDRSYSLYLIQGVAHFIVVLTIPRFAINGTATGVVVILVSLLMADLVYRWCEKPAIAWGRAIINRRGQRRAARPEPLPPAAEPVPVAAG
ncbi:acyltransferase family protein [Saccharothrix australiensis]|uniref:Peptidoglycan/LPS O-acetylase OafA/YrhL n=1 Tax=Saccharothrix australiensis TaxID=2072 RepID=A0A495VUC2_9PSEU|nr:acyltransferase [Saccharothrix australiensis]RKT53001.1 peptidoglycan/LPS O-acetylase OafA/YrhL [Saccharothrix australiensis]